MKKRHFKTKVINTKIIAKDTLAVFLEKPTDFSYNPGQYTILTLKNDDRYLSFASAPSEESLLLVVRHSESEFKLKYQSLLAGDIVVIDKAGGNFKIPSNIEEPVVLLSGGVGITSMRSLVKEIIIQKSSHNIVLFNSNRFVIDAPFLGEFQEMEKSVSNFTFIPTFTKEKNIIVKGNYQKGYITDSMIKQFVKDPTKANYLIAGSHPFLKGMQNQLKILQVSNEKIQQEVYCGYCPEHSCCCDFIH